MRQEPAARVPIRPAYTYGSSTSIPAAGHGSSSMPMRSRTNYSPAPVSGTEGIYNVRPSPKHSPIIEHHVMENFSSRVPASQTNPKMTSFTDLRQSREPTPLTHNINPASLPPQPPNLAQSVEYAPTSVMYGTVGSLKQPYNHHSGNGHSNGHNNGHSNGLQQQHDNGNVLGVPNSRGIGQTERQDSANFSLTSSNESDPNAQNQYVSSVV